MCQGKLARLCPLSPFKIKNLPAQDLSLCLPIAVYALVKNSTNRQFSSLVYERDLVGLEKPSQGPPGNLGPRLGKVISDSDSSG